MDKRLCILLIVLLAVVQGRNMVPARAESTYQQQYQQYQQQNQQQGQGQYNPYGVDQLTQQFQASKDRNEQLVDSMRQQSEQLATQLKPLEQDWNSLKERFLSIVRPYLSSFAQQLQELFSQNTSGLGNNK